MAVLRLPAAKVTGPSSHAIRRRFSHRRPLWLRGSLQYWRKTLGKIKAGSHTLADLQQQLQFAQAAPQDVPHVFEGFS